MPHLHGTAREAVIEFPPTLDEYITPDNPVRFLDAFVDQLDLVALGFERAVANPLGRPAYAPGDLLKLYLYGYLNRIRSSRLLEREAQRNVEVMWLLKKLTPDFKTIADFRKDNHARFKSVFREFTLLCRQLELFGGELVAIDGSKFKAVNNQDRNFTKPKLQRLLKETEEQINRYLQQLEQGDADTALLPSALNAKQLQTKIEHLGQRHERYRGLAETLQQSGQTQISLTDADSRSMPKSPKVPVGYNVQVAVDGKHHLMVEQEVTNEVNDQNQLSAMAQAAQTALGVQTLEVVADKGYYDGEQIKECADHDITCFIAKPHTSLNIKRGLFSKADFRYDHEKDCYHCPANQELRFHFETTEAGRRIRYYWTTACRTCPLRSRCTREKERRRISRWVHEDILEAMQERVAAHPEKMKQRKQIVEHPFGTLKHWWDQSHFLLRGLQKVRGEFSLSALAYNLRRVFTIVGVPQLLEALKSQNNSLKSQNNR